MPTDTILNSSWGKATWRFVTPEITIVKTYDGVWLIRDSLILLSYGEFKTYKTAINFLYNAVMDNSIELCCESYLKLLKEMDNVFKTENKR